MAFKKKSTNPWEIQSIYDLQFFNCPACVYKDVSKESFVCHAYENHSDSTTFLANIKDGSLDDIHCPWRLNIEIKDEIEEEDPFIDTEFTQSEANDAIKTEHKTCIEEEDKIISIDYESKGAALCKKCGKTFLNSKYLISHMSEEHSTGQIRCASCIQTFKTMPELEQHFETSHSHLDAKGVRCGLCNEKFLNYNKLVRHKEIIHMVFPKRNRSSKCNDCLMPLSSFKSQELHEEKCQILQQKICDFCNLQFSDLAELKQHRQDFYAGV